MLWTSLRFSFGNTLAIAAFCALSLLGFLNVDMHNKTFMDTTVDQRADAAQPPQSLSAASALNIVVSPEMDCRSASGECLN
jgi:hypothetical protein